MLENPNGRIYSIWKLKICFLNIVQISCYYNFIQQSYNLDFLEVRSEQISAVYHFVESTEKTENTYL